MRGGVISIVAVRAMSAAMRRAAARGAVPCRISPAVSFLRLVEYRFFFSSYRYEFLASSWSFWRLVPYSPVLRGIMPVWKYGLPCSPFRFCLASSHRIVSSHRHVSSFRLVSSLRLISTRSAIRFARYGRREEGVPFDYLYWCRFLNNSVWVSQSGVDVVEYVFLPRLSIYHETSNLDVFSIFRYAY